MNSDKLALEAQVRALMQSETVPGVSLAIVRNGMLEQVVTIGVRDISKSEPVDCQTVFGAASLTKPMMAYAVLQIVDAGELDLEEPLTRFTAPVVADDAASHSITARHVLTHSSGLPNMLPKETPLRIHFRPGSRFSYSSVGFAYLQKAIEAISMQPLEATMRELVFDPLAMHSSSLAWQERFENNFAHPHEEGKLIAKQRLVANASGSLQTTAADYGAFLSAILNGDRLKERTSQQWLKPWFNVPKASVEQLDVPLETNDDVAWGLGWGLELSRGTFFQWGWMDGVRAFVMGNLTERTAAVLLTNSDTGLRLVPQVIEAVMPGAHPAIEWLGT